MPTPGKTNKQTRDNQKKETPKGKMWQLGENNTALSPLDNPRSSRLASDITFHLQHWIPRQETLYDYLRAWDQDRFQVLCDLFLIASETMRGRHIPTNTPERLLPAYGVSLPASPTLPLAPGPQQLCWPQSLRSPRGYILVDFCVPTFLRPTFGVLHVDIHYCFPHSFSYVYFFPFLHVEGREMTLEKCCSDRLRN